MTIDDDNAQHHRRQLRGWLSYAFASEVFVVVSLTLFLPICLEQFARDNGRLAPARVEACTAPVSVSLAQAAESRCVVKIGWVWIDTASFSLYVYSISVALQALTVISMGGIADHPRHRKRLLLSFAALGSLSATAFLLLPSSSSLWLLAAPLAAAANVGFGASIVAMNAYLPALARTDSTVVRAGAALHEAERQAAVDPSGADADLRARESESDSVAAPLLPTDPFVQTSPSLDPVSPPLATPAVVPTQDAQLVVLRADYHTALSTSTARISARGIALGYAAGIALLLLTLVPVTLLKGSTWALRLAIGLSGLWWGLGSVPAALWLPSGAAGGKAAADGDDGAWGDREEGETREPRDREDDEEWSTWREIWAAWRRLGGMLRPREIMKLRNTFKYLAAWFLLSDGFSTITSTALLFGKTTLHMSPSALILIGVLTPSAGIAGAVAWPRIQSYFGWSNLRVLVILVGLASAIPAYGCLGFLPVFKNGSVKFGGLTTQEEMFALAVYFGAVYGAFQSYARAFYAELIPPGEAARWYGLFSITDKSSSFLGPLVVGLIADRTGDIRAAFFFLVFMVWAALPLLGAVDVRAGRRDAERYVYR